jgi:hypothetical protein
MAPVHHLSMKRPLSAIAEQGPGTLGAHRRPGYPLPSCVPAELGSVSPGAEMVSNIPSDQQLLGDTGVMPLKIHIAPSLRAEYAIPG